MYIVENASMHTYVVVLWSSIKALRRPKRLALRIFSERLALLPGISCAHSVHTYKR